MLETLDLVLLLLLAILQVCQIIPEGTYINKISLSVEISVTICMLAESKVFKT